MHKPSSFRDYLIATLIAAALIVFFGLYLFIRRGYLFDAPPTADPLYVPNKALAGAGMTLLALTFLVGPIVRYFDRFDSWLGYRKEIGIVGAFLALFHASVSYFFLPLKFTRSGIDFTSLYFGAGLIGLIFLIILFILSFKRIITIIQGGRWWFLQRFGLRLAIGLTLVHVYAMKWEGWVKWFTTPEGGKVTAELANPWLPGLGLLGTMFITWVVIVRSYESIFLFKDFGFSPKEISLDINLRARGRRFFIVSFWILILLYLIVLTRFVF
jgi:DMSO/TMAO reductase YedYZ heme-binding membrane subunit